MGNFLVGLLLGMYLRNIFEAVKKKRAQKAQDKTDDINA